MILFVFEGAVKERTILETMFELYPGLSNNDPSRVLCSFGTDLRTLCKRIKDLEQDGGEADIVRVLKETHQDKPQDDIHKIEKLGDVSHIYLFFDYDFHCKGLNLSTYHDELWEMLTRFNNETDEGKLYISYPMVEALLDKRTGNSPCELQQVSLVACGSYKADVAHLGLANKAIVQKGRRGLIKEDKLDIIKTTWIELINLNLCRAMALCQDKWEFPTDLNEVGQELIYHKQYDYEQGGEPRVCVLSSFPLFILEYFGVEGTTALLLS